MQRRGRRNRPFYRIHAVDKRVRRDGSFIENLGWYDPVAPDEDKQISLKPERIRHWLDQGAQPSETVRDLLAKHDVLNDKERAAWEADRTVARNRVVAMTSVEKAEKAAAAIGELDGGDLSSFQASASEAIKDAAAAKSAGDPAKAQAAADKAEKALADAKSASEAFKKKQAEEEAAKAAAEAAASESEGGESQSEESSE